MNAFVYPAAASVVIEVTVGCSQNGYVWTAILLEAVACSNFLLARVLKTGSSSQQLSLEAVQLANSKRGKQK